MGFDIWSGVSWGFQVCVLKDRLPWRLFKVKLGSRCNGIIFVNRFMCWLGDAYRLYEVPLPAIKIVCTMQNWERVRPYWTHDKTSFQNILFCSNSPIKGFIYIDWEKLENFLCIFQTNVTPVRFIFDLGLQSVVMKEITEPGRE
jgi:hypothetical protein